MSTGAACDLGQFICHQRPHAIAVEFGGRRKGNMVHIKVQPHANGICGHQIIHIAILIHLNLRITGPRAQSPHDNRSTAFLSPQKLRNSVHIINAKRHNCRARWHAANFFLPAVAQFGKAITIQKIRRRYQSRNGFAHGLCTQKQGFMQATRSQKPIGEDMAPLRVSAELNLIYRQKIASHALRHRLHRADPVFGPIRHNTFFTGHQGHHRWSPQGHNFIINFACQKPQRQANHPRAMCQHTFNRVMGFASIRGAEHGHNTVIWGHRPIP